MYYKLLPLECTVGIDTLTYDYQYLCCRIQPKVQIGRSKQAQIHIISTNNCTKAHAAAQLYCIGEWFVPKACNTKCTLHL